MQAFQVDLLGYPATEPAEDFDLLLEQTTDASPAEPEVTQKSERGFVVDSHEPAGVILNHEVFVELITGVESTDDGARQTHGPAFERRSIWIAHELENGGRCRLAERAEAIKSLD